ncbi:hypothetical protein LY28_03738 [Ruminiclostridium sufflavum DSM 19573]|uniref:Uncharacterized protein n=1 Tax=Ruminiclostridium sufflavum DSM 19573 TaxID=1121337 RepID=A0A318XIE6_9FIRM|nr:hypothetical protein [Ruminiclostridium sufflavum]PYG84235.1 hypothetical protein LY28_03738 [Ruminiclostridium sufflavum DSM 19573]
MKQNTQPNKTGQINTTEQNEKLRQDKDIQRIKPVTKTKQVQRQIKRRTKTFGEKAYKAYIALTISLYSLLYCKSDASAGNFETSIFATGTKSLATDIGKWLMIIAPITGGLVGVYFFIRRQAADEMDQSAATRCC